MQGRKKGEKNRWVGSAREWRRLHFQENQTLKEIAAKYGTSVNAVRYHVNKPDDPEKPETISVPVVVTMERVVEFPKSATPEEARAAILQAMESLEIPGWTVWR